MTKLSEARPPHFGLTESAAPSTPASGEFEIYAAQDGTLHTLNDAGTDTNLHAAASWDSVITDDLSTTDNVTAVDGSWADAGAHIQHTGGSGTFRWLRHDTVVDRYLFMVECEVRIPTQGNNNPHAGVVASWNGTDTTSAHQVGLTLQRSGTSGAPGTVRLHRSNAVFVDTAVGSLALDTWYTLRLHVTGRHFVGTIDGSVVASATFTPGEKLSNRVGLVGLETGDFRNFEVLAPALQT